MTYDPQAYWGERGRTYRSSFEHGRYASQELALGRLLTGLQFETVLEVGCGFGRIGGLVSKLRPGVAYTGIDMSRSMLESAARIPGVLIASSLEDFEPGRTYDLVLAVEVLMHVPPSGIAAAVEKLKRLSSRHLVTVDWTRPLQRPAAHNFLHDYRALMGPADRSIEVGRQTIRHQVLA